MDVEVAPGVRTGQSFNAGTAGHDPSVSLIDPNEIRPLLSAIYPCGLAGKRFLDVACNGGGYCFVACDLGADFALGFDVRAHWIRQAEFLRRCLELDHDRVRFEQFDLRQLDEHLGPERFDLCLFKGIFYHVPDPVAALALAAAHVREVLILDTAVSIDKPDGFLELNFESAEHLMSGVHKLAWLPTGPVVLSGILKWLGFTETRLIFWRKPPNRLARIRIVGARAKPALEHFDRTWP